GEDHHAEKADCHAREWSTARQLQNPTCGNGPPLGNREIPRAGEVHRSGIVKSHALEWPSTQKSQKPTRRRGPPLGNREIPRAGEVHPRESRNLTRRNVLSLRNRRIPRAGTSQRQKITCFRALAPLSYFKNLIYLHSPQKNPLKKSYLIKSSFFRGKELKFVFIEKEELNL